MSMTIMRRIEFNAGHRLLGHEGKCQFFHGHNYTVDFYVTGQQVDDVGRIVDFATLKSTLKDWIDEHWDHGFILYREDHNAIEAIKQVQPTKYYLLPFNPTAENMARYLLEEICPQLLRRLHVCCMKVVVWETTHSCAEACLDIAPPVSPESWAAADVGEDYPDGLHW